MLPAFLLPDSYSNAPYIPLVLADWQACFQDPGLWVTASLVLGLRQPCLSSAALPL